MIKKFIRTIGRVLLSKIRGKQMAFDRVKTSSRRNASKPLIFNLDLHISVLRDLKPAIAACDLDLVSWSISGSNRYTRKLFKVADPVRLINNETWMGLDPRMIKEFNSEYSQFLSRFDGFVVTHTPAFSQIFQSYNKPILVVNSTRYEAPYTSNSQMWENLNQDLIQANFASQLLISSNNLGDRDYLKYFTGIESRITPSLCDYTNFKYSGNGDRKVIVSRSKQLEDWIESVTNGEWVGIRKVLGENYRWRDFDSIAAIFYIPYNISTMSLFEYASAGIPVYVPNENFLADLANNFSGVLSELSYFQVRGLNTSGLSLDNPANSGSPSFIEWWLARADFYNQDLMPGVKQIGSFEELTDISISEAFSLEKLLVETNVRNLKLSQSRMNLIADFKNLL